MEQELKFQLPDQAAYERLASLLGPERGQELQVNHYLDTRGGDIAASGKSMLRVREEGPVVTLTFKLGASRERGYFRSEELEVELESTQAQALQQGLVGDWTLPPLQRLCEVFGPQTELVRQGTMQNLRRTFPLPSGELAELDATTFPDGTVEYELEVETEQPDAVRTYLEGLGVPLVPQELTKYARFLRHR